MVNANLARHEYQKYLAGQGAPSAVGSTTPNRQGINRLQAQSQMVQHRTNQFYAPKLRRSK